MQYSSEIETKLEQFVEQIHTTYMRGNVAHRASLYMQWKAFFNDEKVLYQLCMK